MNDICAVSDYSICYKFNHIGIQT